MPNDPQSPFVTSGLRLGTSAVEPVSHADYPEDLVAKGRDIECLALARAVALHVERRVVLHARRTVIFER